MNNSYEDDEFSGLSPCFDDVVVFNILVWLHILKTLSFQRR